MHEWAWRVVFLHSLVGRGGGFQDEKFGIDMASAVYEMASPALKPATVHSALAQIDAEANYLRNRNGRLYADTVPTLNNILRRIEGNVTDAEALERVEQVVRKLVDKSAVFDLHPNISDGDAIPDKKPKPQLGIIAFDTRDLAPARFIEQRGAAIREHQNQVFLLAPSTVHIEGAVWTEARVQQERRTRQNILALARKAIAVERLKANPENWGVTHEQLQKAGFKDRAAKAPAELRTAIDESYRHLLFPSRNGGQVAVRDLGKGGAGPTGGGSGGLHLEGAILKQLADERELITEEQATTGETLTILGKLFFDAYKQVPVSELVSHFATRRHWPILQAPDLLAQVLVVFPSEAFDDAGNPDPEQAQTGESVPLGALKTGVVMPYHEAQSRGWIVAPKVQEQQFTLTDPARIKQVLNLLAGTALSQSKTQVTVLNIVATLADKGQFQMALTNTTIGALVDNRALFAALNNRLHFADNGQVRLTVGEPEPNCKFLSLLKQPNGQS
ncbi:hypothetical protein CKO31_00100 [Thiohalocapsa halophila]|uniref:Uncharacterized protein n=1 Tax=Thiohalocapsa halophila TaxID=69359 RepID=A0ABS1CBE0_9GAMM|nr:hypothetical protein [Thiohalocapsa halophila]MBK1629157.1 hypothetical protein [Thiohalocapsa halophila]